MHSIKKNIFPYIYFILIYFGKEVRYEIIDDKIIFNTKNRKPYEKKVPNFV
jgi:hypothetical protein